MMVKVTLLSCIKQADICDQIDTQQMKKNTNNKSDSTQSSNKSFNTDFVSQFTNRI